MENEPHEYVVTKMYAYPDEDVRPLDVRIECATDRGRIILRARRVAGEQWSGDKAQWSACRIASRMAAFNSKGAAVAIWFTAVASD
jgi:hypothetical protein